MQIVAYGAQDVYLTGEPQITFFKVVYRRHTNFAIECIKQTFNGSVGYGNYVTAIIARNGDLVAGMHLQIDASLTAGANNYFINGIGYALIEEVTIDIGGQQVDKHFSEWLDIWDELAGSCCKREGNTQMVGKVYRRPVSMIGDISGGGMVGDMSGSKFDEHLLNDESQLSSHLGSVAGLAATYRLYVPLQFWFNRNPGLALPLIALQYHEVKIGIKFRAASGLQVANPYGGALTGGNDPTTLDATLYVDYIYLDTEERRRFAQMSHEYLIDQLQHSFGSLTNAAGTNNKIRLTFNHPVKEIVWVLQDTASTRYCGPLSYEMNADAYDAGSSDGVYDTMLEGQLTLNGHDRTDVRQGSYFRLMQPWAHHTNVPQKSIYVYSFGLRPEEHQPSGTCNFSRIDNAELNLKTNAFSGAGAGQYKVFAVNYNVLRVVSGMGGMAYSN